MQSVVEHKSRVLIADDTEANRTLYSKVLHSAGFEVVEACDGEEALMLANQNNFDLFILDYMMPRMDGAETVRQIRSNEGTVACPILIITASNDEEHVSLAMEAGATDFIQKPANLMVLARRAKHLAGMFRNESLRHEVRKKRVEADEKVRERFVAELGTARKVQEAQLPALPARVRDVTVHGVLKPSGEVGGDLYLTQRIDEDSFAFGVIDVSGHGMASALVAAEAKSFTTTRIGQLPLRELVSSLNKTLHGRETMKYLCMAAGVYRTNSRTLEILNVGLPPVAILRGGEVVDTVFGCGFPVGLFEDATFEQRTIILEPGDRVVMLTDGLTEPWGPSDDVVSALERLQLFKPSERTLGERVAEVLENVAVEEKDDSTALVVDLCHEKTLLFTPELGELHGVLEWVRKESLGELSEQQIEFALSEAVTNLIVHGSKQVDASTRSRGMESYLDSAHAYGGSSQVASVTLRTDLWGTSARLQWEGHSCPPERRTPPSEIDFFNDHGGAGMTVIYDAFDKVEWADNGLEMTLFVKSKKWKTEECIKLDW